MARRSREHRQDIPGYDGTRPSRDERKLQHRATRHATHQMLHAIDDPDEIVLPEQRRGPGNGTPTPSAVPPQPGHHRFRVWKTKFWKRRDNYRFEKAALDARWPTPDELTEG